jgi:hypothetical protein
MLMRKAWVHYQNMINKSQRMAYPQEEPQYPQHHPLSPYLVINASSQTLSGTSLAIDTDVDERDPWLGLKKTDGEHAMLLYWVTL